MEVENEKIVFYTPMPTLVQLASLEVALKIWYSRYSHSVKNDLAANCPRFDSSLDHDQVHEVVETLKIPRSIEKVVEHSLHEIHNEYVEFYRNFILDNETFSDTFKKHQIKRLNANWLVWCGNGKIDYKKTALKMVNAAELSDMQKFLIMCKYCLETELESVSSDVISKFPTERGNFGLNSLAFYWICRLKNELHRVASRRSPSVDYSMAKKCGRHNLVAFEYFLNRLVGNDRIEIAVYKFENSESRHVYEFQPIILSKMSYFEQNELFSRIPVSIIMNFYNLNMPELALSIWMRHKDHMSVNDFAKLIKTLFSNTVSCEKDTRLFGDVWNTAPSHFRSHIIESGRNHIFQAFLQNVRHSSNSFEFLYEFLKLLQIHCREEALRKYTKDLTIYFADSPLMIDVIQLCLPDINERLKLQHEVMGLSQTFERSVNLVNQMNFENLRLMLEIYSPNIDFRREFVTRLLKSRSIKTHIFITNRRKWNELHEFISNIFLNDEDDQVLQTTVILNIEKKFVEFFSIFNKYPWNDDGCVDDASQIVEQLLMPEELTLFKRRLLNCFRNNIQSTSYWKTCKESSIDKFASWCLADIGDGDDKIKQFKSVFSIDDAFDRMIREVYDSYIGSVRKHVDDDLIDALNKCLKWYFTDDQVAKNYKIRRMVEFDKHVPANSMLRIELTKLLQKVFNNDPEQMRKFRLQKLNRECIEQGMKVKFKFNLS
ncbi:uncharacterized protein LOC135836156 isoform X1 [Planococcus citri]|uniref:uncharacterized protein LOC135836156 isoform X1 n=1 Tax=Planococcus citri TaxID=170843 RepID=UPI0031F806F4